MEPLPLEHSRWFFSTYTYKAVKDIIGPRMSISARHWNRLCRAHVGYSLPEPGWLSSLTMTGGWSGGGAVRLGCFTVMILVRSIIGKVAAFFLGPVPSSDLPTIRLLWWLSTAQEILAASEENRADFGLPFLLEIETFWSQPIHQPVRSKWPSPAVWALWYLLLVLSWCQGQTEWKIRSLKIPAAGEFPWNVLAAMQERHGGLITFSFLVEGGHKEPGQ